MKNYKHLCIWHVNWTRPKHLASSHVSPPYSIQISLVIMAVRHFTLRPFWTMQSACGFWFAKIFCKISFSMLSGQELTLVKVRWHSKVEYWQRWIYYNRFLQLHDMGASPRRTDRHGFFAIHESAKHASSRSMEILLGWGEAHGCCREEMINFFDAEGNVPLHSAVHGGDLRV